MAAVGKLPADAQAAWRKPWRNSVERRGVTPP
jgi:hypothetical protein